MRVYVGTTLEQLGRFRADDEVGPPPLSGHAVTPALRESYASGDAEELEYVALTHAAADSLSLLEADPAATPRRVVLALDPADGEVTAGGAGSAVTVRSAVPLRLLAAVHVDDPGVDLADADGWELMWFARQELDVLLA